MSLFSNPLPVDKTLEEGTVIQVDHIRSICRVRTIRGRSLNEVQWMLPSGGNTRGSDRFAPCMGDRAVLSYGLGYPVIIGFLPRLQTPDNTSPIEIYDGEQAVNLGTYGPGTLVHGDQNKPKDYVPGDRIISTPGGSLLGLLRGGSVLLRASRGAEVLMSNYLNLVRIVSRNWTHFTDLTTDVIRNFKGRVYRYTGYGKSFTDAKNENYALNFYYGDVAAAEDVKAGFDSFSGTPTAQASPPIVYKQQVIQDNGPVNSRIKYNERTINLQGEEELVVKNGTHLTRIKVTAENVTVTWNDQNTVVVTEASIHAHHKDGADYIMDSNGIRATYSSGTINMQSGNVTTSFGGGSAVINSGSSTLSHSGHQITITGGGVAIS